MGDSREYFKESKVFSLAQEELLCVSIGKEWLQLKFKEEHKTVQDRLQDYSIPPHTDLSGLRLVTVSSLSII